jgi:hypothetical protein
MARQRSQPPPAKLSARTSPAAQRPRRGRPQKFGRPSQVVALTLPEEVLEALRTVHRDPGWAIVQLVDPILSRRIPSRRPQMPKAAAELVQLPGRRALIVVEPGLFTALRGVSTIPLADGRAFLALDPGAGIADLEVALLDRLDLTPLKSTERAQLTQVRDTVRAWRLDPGLTIRTKSIIVVEGMVSGTQRPLNPLKKVEADSHTSVREPGTRDEA